MLSTTLFLTLDLLTLLCQLYFNPDNPVWPVLYHFTHLSLHYIITFHHSSVLQRLEHVTSVKQHLMTKLINNKKAETSAEKAMIPRPSFKASPLRRPTRSWSFEETTRDRTAREENRKKLVDLSSNEGLYDSLTFYLTIVCCVLYLPLVLGERTVFSVYFLTLFSTAWSTVISYCVQEGCWHTFYICLGWSDKMSYRKGIDRSVSFNEMIQCMEFDDTQVSPGPLNSKITFVDSITRQSHPGRL
ncbi:uncharacterized protein LOC134811431 [Bolinopsis microptera]|uniref:uncharacterized protein LOC134811431 n=1 Tax=Bolinopsis microptera TaxID=2820187 RepID=UPI003079AAEA